MSSSAPSTLAGRLVIDLAEYGSAEFRLSPAQVSALKETSTVQVTRLRADRYMVKAKAEVGSAVFGTGPDAVVVRIRPKVPIRRLLFLLGYAQDKGRWWPEDVEADEAEDLLPAIARAFTRTTQRAFAGGLLHSYRPVEDDLLTIRGRVRSDEMRRRGWSGPALPCEYDEFTVDIAENQVLLAAAQRLLALPGIMRPTRRALREIANELVDVTPPGRGESPPTWTSSAHNSRYRTALDLADLILRGRSYEYTGGAGPTTVRVDGFLVTMWTVFEAFVTKAVADALRHPPTGRVPGRHVLLQDKTHHLDRARLIQLKPDLVCYQQTSTGHRAPIAVLDAKYKIEKDADSPDTIYQLLAYCAALGLPAGHVVYAATSDEIRYTYVLTTGIAITFHPLDLTAPLPDLRRQINEIAAEMTK
ncbi:5-methylcytosine-specific restriction enzyme subunit McrC [Frankia sp. AiPs1]|uniref:McrC family protein n=1 Tax=Frankia sp. AiPa1 TaxID=573492 RepID=UPI00202B5359|nr:McrC family protein [Frankia sp. AiPa1]MCL9760939.1 McrC family protein [Frankia sp. AiPa1]